MLGPPMYCNPAIPRVLSLPWPRFSSTVVFHVYSYLLLRFHMHNPVLHYIVSCCQIIDPWQFAAALDLLVMGPMRCVGLLLSGTIGFHNTQLRFTTGWSFRVSSCAAHIFWTMLPSFVIPVSAGFCPAMLRCVAVCSFKGTVSPDIVFYFRVYKFKVVLLVRLLMVFKFVYFVVL